MIGPAREPLASSAASLGLGAGSVSTGIVMAF